MSSQWELVAERITLLLVLVSLFLAGYFGLSEFNSTRSHYFDVAFAFEADLPFVAWMIYPYNLNLVAVALAILAVPVHCIEFYRRVALVFGVNLLIALAFFAVVPVQMLDRPDLIATGDFTTDYAAFMFWLDRPTNLFPSMHVQLSVLAALTLASRGRLLGAVGFAITAAVWISTILLKQHYIVDGVLGATIASTSWYLMMVRHRTEDTAREPMDADAVAAD